MSVNTTGNSFYETVYFYKGSNAKASLLPNEDGKADLGSTRFKFDNVYANNIRGGSGQITSGTWRPVVRWSTKNYTYERPTFPVPTVTTTEAGYEKIGNRVFCFSVLTVNLRQRVGSKIYSDVGGLPFEIYQRHADLGDGMRKYSYNPFNYNFGRIVGFDSSGGVFARWTDSTKRSITSSDDPYTAIEIPTTWSPATRYFYQRFSYRTR